MKLNDLQDAAIIISASGMAEAGRIRHRLKNNIGDPKNLVLFVGYCAELHVGAQILAGKNPVNSSANRRPVRAQIASLDAFSGHAGQKQSWNDTSSLSRAVSEDFRDPWRGKPGAGIRGDVAWHETEGRSDRARIQTGRGIQLTPKSFSQPWPGRSPKPRGRMRLLGRLPKRFDRRLFQRPRHGLH